MTGLKLHSVLDREPSQDDQHVSGKGWECPGTRGLHHSSGTVREIQKLNFVIAGSWYSQWFNIVIPETDVFSITNVRAGGNSSRRGMASSTGVYDVTLGVCFLRWIIQVEVPHIKNRKKKRRKFAVLPAVYQQFYANRLKSSTHKCPQVKINTL